ncbi:hypothetical protein CPJ18_01815 [Agrobacterium rosae]|uniref:Transposase n=1 Tax=Agrobacterium rosae TaxID=1972867 RepID=A0AAE5S1U5_9HYPH|nr:hypothetical protein CPJ18_01815 [Agrobacterium rosae]
MLSVKLHNPTGASRAWLAVLRRCEAQIFQALAGVVASHAKALGNLVAAVTFTNKVRKLFGAWQLSGMNRD